MKALPVIPAALTLVAMIIIAAVRPAHGHGMMLAAAITGVVTFGCVSLVVAMAKKEVITVVQTALVSTVGQMMLSGGAAIVLGMAGVSGEFRAFAIWVIVFYW